MKSSFEILRNDSMLYIYVSSLKNNNHHNWGKISLKDCEYLERPRSSVGRAQHLYRVIHWDEFSYITGI